MTLAAGGCADANVVRMHYERLQQRTMLSNHRMDNSRKRKHSSSDVKQQGQPAPKKRGVYAEARGNPESALPMKMC